MDRYIVQIGKLGFMYHMIRVMIWFTYYTAILERCGPVVKGKH